MSREPPGRITSSYFLLRQRRWPFKQVSMLTSWMTAKRPDQTLPFRLYLFDTSVGVGLDHPPIFPSDGLRGLAISRHGSRPPAEHRPPVSSILTPFPPAWRGLPVRSPESQSPIGCCESPPSLRVFSSPYPPARLSV
ncbi:hypothetical protein G5714_022147 [Onychostoma macrolepis]|uniref:Uncharacterized protein n=1 Tax=Onychostoma macrolepis TaxID=369639 RepID=A0A7J6BMD7_9TELE|nr:hypothetical protein G5714_022147 [Onychostoma macrolepis]